MRKEPRALDMNAVVGFYSVPFLASVPLPGSLLLLPTWGEGKWALTYSCLMLSKPS